MMAWTNIRTGKIKTHIKSFMHVISCTRSFHTIPLKACIGDWAAMWFLKNYNKLYNCSQNEIEDKHEGNEKHFKRLAKREARMEHLVLQRWQAKKKALQAGNKAQSESISSSSLDSEEEASDSGQKAIPPTRSRKVFGADHRSRSKTQSMFLSIPEEINRGLQKRTAVTEHQRVESQNSSQISERSEQVTQSEPSMSSKRCSNRNMPRFGFYIAEHLNKVTENDQEKSRVQCTEGSEQRSVVRQSQLEQQWEIELERDAEWLHQQEKQIEAEKHIHEAQGRETEMSLLAKKLAKDNKRLAEKRKKQKQKEKHEVAEKVMKHMDKHMNERSHDSTPTNSDASIEKRAKENYGPLTLENTQNRTAIIGRILSRPPSQLYSKCRECIGPSRKSYGTRETSLSFSKFF